ncbi:MAG: GGDEF domain-containing protein [Nitrospirae bacterium]|nr:GGDEF domain-containing protein [Nitrospirota bacterium]
MHLRILASVCFLIFGAVTARVFIAKNRVEEALQESEERFRSLVESTRDSIYLVDRGCRYLFINRRHMLRLGVLDGDYRNKTFGDFHSSEETGIFTAIVSKVFENGESIDNEYKSSRDRHFYLQTFSPVKDKDSNVLAVTVISKAITERKQMEDNLRTLSFTDELTGLLNRRGFFVLAEQQLKMACREKKGLFLLSADLDDLKDINDTFGHKEGDLMLIDTARILQKCYRESDIIARIGGDEFVMLVNESSGANVEALSSRLRVNLCDFNSQANRPYKLAISLGIACYYHEQPRSLNELLSDADKSMYEMKKKREINR